MTEQGAAETRLAKMHPRRGVVINYLEYWSERFLDPGLKNKTLRVQFYPEDVSTISVEIDGAPVECYCRHYPEMKGVTVAQVKNAMREMRERQKAAARMSNALIVNFLKQISESEEQLQEETRHLSGRNGFEKPKREGSRSRMH